MVDYEKYWSEFQKKHRFALFIVVLESGRVYRHTPTNPEQFEKRFMRGHSVYIIPDQLLSEITPEALKPLDAWLVMSRRFGTMNVDAPVVLLRE